MIFSVRSETVEIDGKEKERVEGRESPGKDERRTFTLSAILTNRADWLFILAVDRRKRQYSCDFRVLAQKRGDNCCLDAENRS